jgi:hypothetical protein
VDDVEQDQESEDEDDPHVPSIIPDPGRATPKERRWLTKMSEGKSPWISKRFETYVELCTPSVRLLRVPQNPPIFRRKVHGRRDPPPRRHNPQAAP